MLLNNTHNDIVYNFPSFNKHSVKKTAFLYCFNEMDQNGIVQKNNYKDYIKWIWLLWFSHQLNWCLNFVFFISVIFSSHKNSYPVTDGVTYLSLTFDYVYSFVDERGKVCPSTQTDVWCDLIVHLQHIMEAITVPLCI